MRGINAPGGKRTVVNLSRVPRSAEVDALAARYGTPLTRVVRLGANCSLIHAAARGAEVCMVMRFATDGFVTMTKAFYPPDVYRLPTGGIDRGESVLDALHREVLEETGQDAAILAFLAVIGYQTSAAASEFLTFAFLLESAGKPQPQDVEEQITGFRVVARDQLPVIADRLDRLPDTVAPHSGRSWADWGRFRSPAHRVVWEALAASPRGWADIRRRE
jgi:ADP-ribose pyrophosphatase YjhB (NUDIX family)